MFRNARKLGAILLPSTRVYITASIVVLLTFLSVTIWTWRNAVDNLDNDFQTNLNSGTKSAADLVQSTVGTYGEVLRGAAGLFNVDPNLSEKSWQSYIDNLRFEQRYPGMQGISYIQTVPSDQLGDFLANNTTSDGQPYVISPDTPRNTYNVTRYISPNTPEQRPYIGYDPSTENVRGTAMNLARDTGALAVSGRVTRIVDKQPGFVLYVPVYKEGMPVQTVEQRQAAIKGYVSAGVRIQDLINGLFGKLLNNSAAVELYAGKFADTKANVYRSKSYNEVIKRHNASSATQLITVSGNDWLLVTHAVPNYSPQSQHNLSRTILFGGIALSVLASALIFTIMVSRGRTITAEKNREVQEVKDSLIALASHQLRTPATGVKQFVGMVLEGYAGPIKPTQKEMLEKAYLSNERQIKIINQILHVSRADSGRLVLTFSKLNLTKTIKTIKAEQAQIYKDRGQKLILKLPKTDVFIHADEQYIAMAIDNLLSNASKYSFQRSAITVTLRRTRNEVVLSVADKGVGIDPKDMHLLFQKFSRIHNDLSIAAGGSGIGLYLCREIIELHGGTIEVASEPGKGSVFTVIVPRKPPLN